MGGTRKAVCQGCQPLPINWAPPGLTLRSVSNRLALGLYAQTRCQSATKSGCRL